MRSSFLAVFLLVNGLFGQSGFGTPEVPLDTLFAGDSLGIGQRVLLKPIQWWQHYSYGSTAMNCQFDASCSNFMVDAILQKGALPGLVMGTDRIIRCNHSARKHHFKLSKPQFTMDGRLVEQVEWEPEEHPGKNPALAMMLSTVPGLGRAYTGHYTDAVLSAVFISFFAWDTYGHIRANEPVRAGISASFTTLFWLADFYGAYRTASQISSKKTQQKLVGGP